MAKKVTVALFGSQRRGVQIDIDATKGAVLGENLLLPDGTVVPTTQIINQTTIVQTSGGPAAIASTLWSLILEIPAFIQALAALATGTTGIVVKGAGDTALARSIVGTVGEIEVVDGDGVAGNPTIKLTNWPRIKTSIGSSESYIIPAGYQLLVEGEFDVQGTLDAKGSMVIL